MFQSDRAGPAEGLYVVIIVLCSMAASRLHGNTAEILQAAARARPKVSLQLI